MTRPSLVHVVGAGLAGLAASVSLIGRGKRVRLYEAGVQAGGRCRSYFDAQLGHRIDNGNHLLFSGNHAALGFLETIGAGDSLMGPGESVFPFIDLETGKRWTVRPGQGRLPLWLFDAERRLPDTRASDYLSALRLILAPRARSVADTFRGDKLFRRLWEPLTVAMLSTRCEDAAAGLLRAMVLESFARGGRACIPLVPREGLSESFVDPALSWIKARGAELRFGARLRAIECTDGRVSALDFGNERVELGDDESIVLAVTAPVAGGLLPEITVPKAFRAIVNAHFLADARWPGDAPFIGVVGGLVEWIFVKDGVLSVTISAADRLIDEETDALAQRIWAEVARVFEMQSAPLPANRIVKEKRATFAATAAEDQRRPHADAGPRNLALAGDWTQTGLPATIEGAIRSGRRAADLLLAS